MKKIKFGLLAKVVIAIILGSLLSNFLPLSIVRIFETFNTLFSEYLNFIIPLIIVGLIVSGIAELGKSAGKLLLITALIAWFSTILAGFISYFTAIATFPNLLTAGDLSNVNEIEHSVTPFFTINFPPVFGVTSALILAFILGLTISSLKASGKPALYKGFEEFRELIMKVITLSVIPLLPIFIFGIFLKLGYEGEVSMLLTSFIKVIAIIFVLHVLWLLFQFMVTGFITKRNPLLALKSMLPAYMTALGTQSSAATIPVTLQCVNRMGVKPEVSGFVVPLCATIHLSGSILKVVACAVAVSYLTNMPIDFQLFVSFIIPLSITVIAAPGVPGGVIMACLGLLASILGYSDNQIGIMIALYIGMDSFGTACNVTGDGAISLIVDKISRTKG